MKKIYLILLLPFICFSQQKRTENKAAEEFLSKIESIQKSLVENNSSDFNIVKEIICITKIYPKKVDGTYIGIIYFPTLEEVKIWKDWFEKNKAKIQYKPKTKIIMFEYETEKFRYSDCRL